MLPLLVWSMHAEHNILEMVKEPKDGYVENQVEGPLCLLVQSSGSPINAKSKDQDGEIKSRVVVMNVCHSSHDDERQIVQEPSEERIYARKVEVVNVVVVQVVVTTLPADKVPCNHEGENAE